MVLLYKKIDNLIVFEKKAKCSAFGEKKVRQLKNKGIVNIAFRSCTFKFSFL